MNKSLKITWVRVRWLVSFTPTLLLQCQCSGTSKMFTLMSSEYIGFKAEYLGDFSVNHGVKSEEKYAVPKDRQKISNMYLLNTFPCSSVPPLSARLSVPGSVSSSGSKSGVSLTAGSWYNVSCSATGSSPFVFYNWSLGPGPAERDKQVTLSILSRGMNYGWDIWTNHVINLRQSSNDGCDDHYSAAPSTNTNTYFLQIGNSSVIELLAQVGHHNSNLSCIAFNPLLPDIVARDTVKILIHCEWAMTVSQLSVNEPNYVSSADKPKVSLNLGKSIEMNKIKEGEDIYLECSVDSRPPPYKLFFKHQVI